MTPRSSEAADAQLEEVSWPLTVRLTRDVCYLFHVLANYRYIMGDLDYATEFSYPYWRVLNRLEDRFVRSGILVLFLAMIQDGLDDGGWMERHLDAIEPQLLRLLEAVTHGVDLVRRREPADERFEIEVAWAFTVFVKGYFEDAAR